MYVMSMAPAFAIEDRRLLKRWMITVATMYVVATPIWILYPVEVPREYLPPVDYYSYLIFLIQSVDPSTNCFPSMHVAVATVAGLVIWRIDKIVGTLLLLSAFPIWYSTVAVGQHWIVDGAAGFILAWCSYMIVFYINPLPKTAFTKMPRVGHLLWIGFLILSLAALWIIFKYFYFIQ